MSNDDGTYKVLETFNAGTTYPLVTSGGLKCLKINTTYSVPNKYFGNNNTSSCQFVTIVPLPQSWQEYEDDIIIGKDQNNNDIYSDINPWEMNLNNGTTLAAISTYYLNKNEINDGAIVDTIYV